MKRKTPTFQNKMAEKTIILTFLIRMKLFQIVVKGKKVFYNDSIQGVQELYPNPSPKAIQIGGEPSQEEIAEYNLCKTEDELASVIIRDCRLKGITLIKKEVKDEVQT